MQVSEAEDLPSLAVQSDAILVERAVDGDAMAFEVLVRRYGPMVRAYARRLSGPAVDADDIAQEALLQAWRQLPDLREGSAVGRWLISITSHCGIDLLRRCRTTLVTHDADVTHIDRRPTPEATAIDTCELGALSEALHRLPESQRRCWLLRESGGHSYQEIATILTISVPSVRGHLSRARTTMIKAMEAWR